MGEMSLGWSWEHQLERVARKLHQFCVQSAVSGGGISWGFYDLKRCCKILSFLLYCCCTWNIYEHKLYRAKPCFYDTLFTAWVQTENFKIYRFILIVKIMVINSRGLWGYSNDVHEDEKPLHQDASSYIKAPGKNSSFVLVLVPPLDKSGTAFVLSSTKCFLTIHLFLYIPSCSHFFSL